MSPAMICRGRDPRHRCTRAAMGPLSLPRRPVIIGVVAAVATIDSRPRRDTRRVRCRRRVECLLLLLRLVRWEEVVVAIMVISLRIKGREMTKIITNKIKLVWLSKILFLSS